MNTNLWTKQKGLNFSTKSSKFIHLVTWQHWLGIYLVRRQIKQEHFGLFQFIQRMT
jgi:hypothetical protein